MKYFCFFFVFFLTCFFVHSRHINSDTVNSSRTNSNKIYARSGVAPPIWGRTTTASTTTVTRGIEFVGKLVTESSVEDGLQKRFMIAVPDRCEYPQKMVMGKCRTVTTRSSKEMVNSLGGNAVKLKTTREPIHSKDDVTESLITVKNTQVSSAMILTEIRCVEPLKLVNGKCKFVSKS